MSQRGKHNKILPNKRLCIFLDCVEELKDRPYILKGLHNFQFRIDLQKETGKIICEVNEADQEEFRSYLMTFRKFLLNDEPANIDAILNICRRFVRSEQKELIEVVEQFKTIWSYQYRKGTIQITSGNLNLTPKYVLDLWLNGKYFHNGNPQKTELLKQLLNKELPSVKLQLLWSLPILTETAIRIGGLIDRANNEGAFNFPKEK